MARTPREYLETLYPTLAGSAQLAMALEIAEEFKPPCLREALQNIAMAHYAAYVLQTISSSSSGATTAGLYLASEREGEVARSWRERSNAAETEDGPTGPYAAWKDLADRCRRGAIMNRFYHNG